MLIAIFVSFTMFHIVARITALYFSAMSTERIPDIFRKKDLLRMWISAVFRKYEIDQGVVYIFLCDI